MIRRTITATALAALVAVPLIAGPTSASASCQSRKTTGTVLGGVGGALLGNSISHGGGGAIIGGLGGAVVGHEIGKSGCRTYTRHAYYRRSNGRYASSYHSRQAYYDERGNLVTPSDYRH